MKKKTPFLDFYYECVTIRSFEHKVSKYYRSDNLGGLCNTGLKRHPIFQMIKETAPKWGYWGYVGANYFWADSESKFDEMIRYEFTPLRQNIVLLCACLNNEL